MRPWTGDRVAAVLGAGAPRPEMSFARVWTDTRTLAPGDLFVALRGDRFDGHTFLVAARAAGATGAVVERGTPPVDGLVLFPVDHTLRALGRLARARRDEISGPVVAVTGTNGKTATKELLARALATRWTVHATHANLNNEVGVPLTLLTAPGGTDALVVEAGTSVPGEIARLREIIAPGIGVVTNVSAGHLEGFGSLEGVLAEKARLLDGVPIAVVGTEPPALADRARALADDVLVAGLAPPADVRPDAWHLAPGGTGVFVFRGHEIHLPLIGRHQVENAMLACAVAEALKLDLAAVAAGLERVTLPGGRGEVLHAGGLTVLNDTYNANPESFRAALETAALMRGDRPLVILVGTMLELGPASEREHGRLADAIVAAEPALIGAVGAFVPALERRRDVLGNRLVTADDPDALGRTVAARLGGDELVLLKASRGVRLERALPHLLPEREAPCSSTS